VHIDKFLFAFAGAVHVEIVKPRLPEVALLAVPRCEPQQELSIWHVPLLSAQIARNALFQYLQHRRRRALYRLADQQMHVIGHHDVPNEQELATLSYLA
jgi:hypothetical protein